MSTSTGIHETAKSQGKKSNKSKEINDANPAHTGISMWDLAGLASDGYDHLSGRLGFDGDDSVTDFRSRLGLEKLAFGHG